ncbi:hypothetical protein [Brevibacillus sp. SYSU BS000544]
MNIMELFWNASMEELKSGNTQDEDDYGFLDRMAFDRKPDGSEYRLQA